MVDTVTKQCDRYRGRLTQSCEDRLCANQKYIIVGLLTARPLIYYVLAMMESPILVAPGPHIGWIETRGGPRRVQLHGAQILL